jgi:hypothetical protein
MTDIIKEALRVLEEQMQYEADPVAVDYLTLKLRAREREVSAYSIISWWVRRLIRSQKMD